MVCFIDKLVWGGARVIPLALVLQYRPFKETASGPFMTDPALTKTIHFCADEWMLLLEALHCYKDTNDGRKVAGRLNWVRTKLEECRAEECLIRLSA
ncbi:MAG: hypothetical protein EBU35_09590 [Marivivens sp.]|nr:hypothetical protein [Marivivens sp.]